MDDDTIKEIKIKVKTNFVENKKIDDIYYDILDNNIVNIMGKTDKITLKFF